MFVSSLKREGPGIRLARYGVPVAPLPDADDVMTPTPAFERVEGFSL
jgi:hypothetical protein